MILPFEGDSPAFLAACLEAVRALTPARASEQTAEAGYAPKTPADLQKLPQNAEKAQFSEAIYEGFVQTIPIRDGLPSPSPAWDAEALSRVFERDARRFE